VGEREWERVTEGDREEYIYEYRERDSERQTDGLTKRTRERMSASEKKK